LSLADFLDTKPLYYSEIDYTRMPRAYASIKEHLTLPKIIHLIGTNGKGTTGRFIANALLALGKSVGHYSSPHIKDFNERIWLNGKNSDDESLEKAHTKLLSLLSDEFTESLSYFEYTTFLAMLVYAECDYVVLEAGLGGEHDATNVFSTQLSVVTPIGMDHEAFLGSTVKEIALTKLRSVDKKAIISKQKFTEVLEVAEGLGIDFRLYGSLLNEDDYKLSDEISESMQLPLYLKDNLLLAMSVLKELGYIVKKNLFNSQRLEGRMQKIRHNVYIDVGHNTLAAEAISHSFGKKSVNLVYNSYKDKDYLSILTLLEPIIKEVQIIPIDDERIVSRCELVGAIEKNGLKYRLFDSIKESEEYLVFGSFLVVEEFSKHL
jgi:dihydrofolate synthase / folylpolyglutamate synthase